MTWGFLWLMFVLKIPILMLLGIVWGAVRQEVDPSEGVPPEEVRARPHPPELPRRTRPRGPHGEDAALPSPPRVRTPAVGREPSRDG
jgi:hypothetical protein